MRAGPDVETWLRFFGSRSEDLPRLLCLPHAGGSASYFASWAAELKDRVEVAAVQYPGRQDRRREPVPASLQDLAADVAEVVLAAGPPRPTALLGHSLGATLAFEVARRLEAAGRPPSLLVVSGRRAPARRRQEVVHRGTDQEIVEELLRLDGTAAALLDDPEVVEMIVPSVRADYRLVETYQYRPGPDVTCPVLVARASDDPYVDDDEAADWARHTTGPTRHQRWEGGGHFYLDRCWRDLLPLVLDPLGW